MICHQIRFGIPPSFIDPDWVFSKLYAWVDFRHTAAMKSLAGTAVILSTITLPFLGFSQEDPATAEEEPTPAELPVAIEMLGRFSQNYTVTFAAKLDAERFQITRENTANYPRATFVVKLDEETRDGKLRVEGFTQKEAINPVGIRMDASELEVTWLTTGKKATLVRRIPETIPTYFAQLKAEGWEEYIKAGDSFSVPSKPKIEFKLVKAEPEAAHVEWRNADGKLRSSKIAKKAK